MFCSFLTKKVYFYGNSSKCVHISLRNIQMDGSSKWHPENQYKLLNNKSDKCMTMYAPRDLFHPAAQCTYCTCTYCAMHILHMHMHIIHNHTA